MKTLLSLCTVTTVFLGLVVSWNGLGIQAHKLGSRCHIDEDCSLEVKGATCENGRCRCVSYHVPLNSTMCVQVTVGRVYVSGTLLGYSCLMDSQCENRVENSTCVAGTCRCRKGFVPYKRHACLPPARLGQICYSDDHCRMWDSDSSCDYIIQNVIGRCRCGGDTRQVGPSCLGPPPNVTSKKPRRAVTLGLPCSEHTQCQAADPHSRCFNGVCDCQPVRNSTASRIPRCSALNPGCYPGTFQCVSTGECISWFFVCDGREHCADRSDEADCAGPVCPELSFTCASGGCVSRAAICDGAIDCPNGEDEEGCQGERSCPAFTLRCRGSTPRCLPEYELCNAVKSCPDGSDELRSVCRGKTLSSSNSKRPRARIAGVTNTSNCPFRCANGRCRSSAVVCSGRDGCGDNSDEEQCAVCRCPAV